MQTLTLLIKDIETLNIAQQKLNKNQHLTGQETECLIHLLNNLPSTAMILLEKLRFDEKINIDVCDLQLIDQDIDKWLQLFNKIPKLGGDHHPIALFADADEQPFYWKNKVIIEVSFVPSYMANRKKDRADKIICLLLKVDGTAIFQMTSFQLAEEYKDLFLFNGSWHEAYIMLIKVLKKGWPQTKFPAEFEQFLKSEQRHISTDAMHGAFLLMVAP